MRSRRCPTCRPWHPRAASHDRPYCPLTTSGAALVASGSSSAALKVVLDALVKEGVLYDDSWVEVRHCGVTAHPPQTGIPGGLWLQIDRIEEAA